MAADDVGGRPAEAATEVLLRFARAGHDAGYPTADLEERVEALADALGLVGTEISATPTIVEVSLGSIPHQRSYTLRVRPSVVDLDAIARLDELVQDLLAGRLDADAGARRPRGASRPGGSGGRGRSSSRDTGLPALR